MIDNSLVPHTEPWWGLLSILFYQETAWRCPGSGHWWSETVGYDTKEKLQSATLKALQYPQMSSNRPWPWWSVMQHPPLIQAKTTLVQERTALVNCTAIKYCSFEENCGGTWKYLQNNNLRKSNQAGGVHGTRHPSHSRFRSLKKKKQIKSEMKRMWIKGACGCEDLLKNSS